jgi:nucleotide-binding universal stress UspA family protein
MSSTFLVPLDGTLFAELALPTAVSLVREHHGRLELVVVHEPQPFDGYPDAPWNAAYRSREKRYVAEKAEQLSGACDSEVGHALRSGEAAAAICAHARAVGACMIVMNTHGRTGARRAWSGSVTRAVITQSALPVLVLRQSLDPDHRRTPPFSFLRVVAVVDESPKSLEIFDALPAVVTRGASEVHLVRIVTPIMDVVDVSLPFGFTTEVGNDDETKALVARAGRELADQTALLEDAIGCDVIPHVLVGRRPAHEILEFSKGVGAQVIAMTSDGGSVSEPFNRGVAAKVLRASGAPVLMVQPRRAGLSRS